MVNRARPIDTDGENKIVTKLTIANGALRLLEERKLSANELTNGTREPARIFNDVWDDGGINACLEAGMWRFAKRTVQLDGTSDLEGDFGLGYVFTKPSDLVRVIGVWSDALCQTPDTTYREEGGFWFDSIETIYVSYVSNDASYGGDYSLWPQSFVKFVQAHFASEIAGPLTSKGQDMHKLRAQFLHEAKSTDAMADPTRFVPAGSWVRARTRGVVRRDGQP